MAKHKYIESPEQMWEYFQVYRIQLKNDPKKRVIKGNKNFIVSDESLERPLTMEGFEQYLFENEIITDVSDYFENKEKRYEDYVPICRIIKKIIRADQIEGGMVGIYTPSITQRLNGLVEKIQEDGSKELTIKVKYERKGNNTE